MDQESSRASDTPRTEEEFAAAWAKAREAAERVEQSRGMLVRQRMEGLGRAISMVESNAAELVDVLKAFESQQLRPVLWAQENEGILDLFLTDISRRLHNYVASVMTLVEHNRILVRRHYGEADPLRVAYQSRLQETFGTPAVAFVQDLRDFTLHYALPPISARFSLSRDQPARSEVLLDRDGLRTYKRWSPKAIAFISEGAEPIDLHGVVDGYMTRVREFYAWFRAAVAEHHAADMAELAELIDATRAAFVAAGHGDYVADADRLAERRREVMNELAQRTKRGVPSPEVKP